MKLSKIFFLLFLSFSIFTFASELDESLLEDEDFMALDDLPEDFSEMKMPTKTITPNDALVILLSANAPGILGLDLYLRTNPLNTRQLTTLPAFLLWHTNYMEYCSLFRFYMFYNQTGRMLFTENSPFIKSYLAVDNDNLLNEIAKNELVDTSSVPDVLALFKNIKIEERRAGILFQWLKNWNKTNLEVDLPFLYQERNFILTESEIADIKASNLFENTNDNKVEESEIRKNVVADLLGFSDLKLKLGHQVLNLPCRSIIAGIEVYLPTAFALKKGLLGSDFSKDIAIPSLSLTELVDFFFNDQNQQAIEVAVEFAKATANRLAAMTIQSELGNNKHLVVDAFAEGRFEFSDMLSLNTYANIKYTFPKSETRYFLVKKQLCSDCPETRERLIAQGKCNDCYVTANYDPDPPPAVAEQNVAFFEQQALITLFPDALKTKVSPGFSGEFAIAPHIAYEGWHISLGYDVWYQEQESLKLLEGDPSCHKMCIAKKPKAYQSRLFGRLYKEISKLKYDFAVGLQGDYCINSIGIGKDFTAAISIEFNF